MDAAALFGELRGRRKSMLMKGQKENEGQQEYPDQPANPRSLFRTRTKHDDEPIQAAGRLSIG
jgi:hypothetical protein